MKFIDLQAQYQNIESSIRERIDAVLHHGHYIMGPEVQELEERLAAFTGSRHCVSCASGTDALLMVLMAWGIGQGDAVFVPAFSFFASAEVPALRGATPIFIDVDPVTFNISPESLACALRAVRLQDATLHPLPPVALQSRPLRARCVIPVDLFGQAAAYETLLPLCQREGLLVLEDAAQAFGGTWAGKKVCGLGCHAAGTSFFPAKPLGCYGDGGAIFTDDDALAAALVSIRTHGKGVDKYNNQRLGINGRLDTLQAAILLPKLDVFEDECRRRQRVAQHYARGLSEIPGIVVPLVMQDRQSVFAQYTVRVEQGQRDALAAHLHTHGIPSNIYYPKPLHVQEAFSSYGYTEGDMPVATHCCSEVLSLPFHPYMEENAVEMVCAAVREFSFMRAIV